MTLSSVKVLHKAMPGPAGTADLQTLLDQLHTLKAENGRLQLVRSIRLDARGVNASLARHF